MSQTTKPPPDEYVLLARVSGTDDESGNSPHYDYVLLGLSREKAKLMLTLRGLRAIVNENLKGTYLGSVYSIEAFDYSVEAGPAITSRFPGVKPHDCIDIEYDAWYRVPSTTEIHDRSKSASTIRVLDDGVDWVLWNEYASTPQMSVPTLSWAALHEIAEGRDPFDAYVEPEEEPDASDTT